MRGLKEPILEESPATGITAAKVFIMKVYRCRGYEA